MRFLAIGERTSDYTTAQAYELMAAEMDTARTLYGERVIREAYMDDSYADAVLLLDAEDLAAATTHVNRYPMVQAGIIHFRITPLVGLPAIIAGATPQVWPDWWPDNSR
ncbi:hypothetical protein ASF06_09425 [Agreia sp. Leaf244]|uniref:hypothetical protein n=1 Tax=Agreia sp. Leaf244 TaxID=1736305 RepID=UPI0006FC7671|nr:hypothetical protein [Agreia sp. Leaf244]KQO10376.1 hypothetical protein ASF06_09425 [Agreia sp. Leaf244]